MSVCCVTLLETPGAFQLFTRNKDLNLCGKRKEVAAVAVAVVAAVFACILMTMCLRGGELVCLSALSRHSVRRLLKSYVSQLLPSGRVVLV